MSAPPIILVPADRRIRRGHPVHSAGEKYLAAVTTVSAAMPLICPALPHQPLSVAALLEAVDGLLLTGSVSNVEPHWFGESVADPSLPLDPERDGLTFELIRQALQLGIPLLGICRGMQELNVALGGSLHQRVHEVAGLQDHRDDPEAPLEVQYGPAHDVIFEPGSMLTEWLDGNTRATVNSLHGQGVARLAEPLQVEARAPDGLIEAVSVRGAAVFALAVQWHPEWRATDDPVSRQIFQRFGAAARDHQRKRTGGHPATGIHRAMGAQRATAHQNDNGGDQS
jgi:putative glutamine amidotransferase